MQVAIFSFKMDLKMKRLIITVLLFMGIFSASHAQKLPPGIEQLLEQSRRLMEEFDQDLPLDTAVMRSVKDTSMVMPRINLSFFRQNFSSRQTGLKDILSGLVPP